MRSGEGPREAQELHAVLQVAVDEDHWLSIAAAHAPAEKKVERQEWLREDHPECFAERGAKRGRPAALLGVPAHQDEGPGDVTEDAECGRRERQKKDVEGVHHVRAGGSLSVVGGAERPPRSR